MWDFSVVAKTTSGFTGADLENLLNEAALLTARAGKKKNRYGRSAESLVKVGIGTEKKSRIISEKENLLQLIMSRVMLYRLRFWKNAIPFTACRLYLPEWQADIQCLFPARIKCT